MPFDEQAQQDLDLQRLVPHVEALASKFDTVQIFVTRHDITTGGTVSVNSGAGNWYARRGQVREWMIQQEELMRMAVYEEDEE
jgi:hypothetical protein